MLGLISVGEGPKLEFKRDDVRPESLARAIAAFANMNGGQILLGVEDDGGISGTTRGNLREWLMDTVIARHIRPHVVPDYEEVRMDGDKLVGVVTVHMGVAKPYEVNRQGRRDVYVRYGSVSKRADREQTARMFATGGFVLLERLPVHGARLDELSAERWRQYLVEVVGLVRGPEVDESWLIGRGILVDVNDSRVCSIFAYALFGKRPGLRLPQAPVRVTVYEGAEKERETLRDEIIDMPYVGLMNQGEVVEPALHQRVVEEIKPCICKDVMIDAVRTPCWDYPEEAIREAVVNALVHRDWTKRDYVRVVVYGDRLEVHSPGSPPNGITVDSIKSGARLLRNQECAHVFRGYGYMESQGMGVCKKIIPACLAHSGREPVFEATEDHFKVTMYKKDACT